MDHLGSESADVEAWTLMNYLEEGGFPALLWDTLKDFGYTAYTEYSTREVMTTGQLLRCEVKVKIFVCSTNPAWEEWVSHPFFRRKPSANLHACQDQVSCI
jgi:hypothetical protein